MAMTEESDVRCGVTSEGVRSTGVVPSEGSDLRRSMTREGNVVRLSAVHAAPVRGNKTVRESSQKELYDNIKREQLYVIEENS